MLITRRAALGAGLGAVAASSTAPLASHAAQRDSRRSIPALHAGSYVRSVKR